MVRLVFRPYTQIRRTICTSVSLRASTRVSPGFTLFRHRSPSFGSQQICSLLKSFTSDDRSIVPPCPRRRFLPQQPSCLYFHCASGFSTQILAYMLDSLVRVSRRVNENHFVRIANTASSSSLPVVTLLHTQNFVIHAQITPGSGNRHLVARIVDLLNPAPR